MRKTMYEWAKEYCGDPASHVTRGELILQFLREEGLVTSDLVLDVGCGALSQGAALIKFLDKEKYVGLDPNGWLIEAALTNDPFLEDKAPQFSFASDFNPRRGGFDFIVAHSVLSHCAHWQLEQALMNLRDIAREGAVWLASLRLDQYNLFARRWCYPDVSYFRIDTVKVLGWHAGWHVETRPEFKERMIEVCPNDFHDWIKLTAAPKPEQINTLRVNDEQIRKQDAEILKIAQAEYQRRERERVEELV